MKINLRVLDRAIEAAKNSDHKIHKIGAVIVDKKQNILSIGWNMMKTHPTQKEWAEQLNNPDSCYLHAEIHALVRMRSDRGDMIYVARRKKTGEVGCAKPCEICELALRESSISTVIYTDDNSISIMDVRNDE